MSYQSMEVQWGLLNMMNCKDSIKLDKANLTAMDNSKKGSDLAKDYNDAKKAINAEYEYDDPQRQVALEEVKDEFEFLKAQLTEVETINQNERDQLNTQIKERQTVMDQLDEKISEEVKQDHNIFKRGGG